MMLRAVLAIMAGSSLCAQDLPEISQDEFEPAIREQIRQAYDAARRNVQAAETVGRLGMLLQCYGKYEAAQQCYTRARRLDPESHRWAYYRGNIEGWLGYPDAVEHLREAVTLDPAYIPGRVRLAEVLFESGDLDASEREYREAIRGNSQFASAYLGLGRVLGARGDSPSAIESYRRACERSKTYAAAQYALAMAYRKTGDLIKARAHLDLYDRARQAVQPSEDPLLEEVKSLYAGGLSHMASGSQLMKLGKFREAASEFESSLKVNPRLMAAHINLIAVYGQLDEASKVEEHFREAVRLDPGWAEAYYNWGLFLSGRERGVDAAEAFRKATELNPSYADAHVQLGLLYEALGRLENATQCYRSALEANPAHHQARCLLGRVLTRTGRFQQAVPHLLESIQVAGEQTPACMQALAAAYEGAGDFEKALGYARQARQLALARHMEALAEQLRKDVDRLSAEARHR